ncbi:MAG TPA: ribonuclease HII [Anaerolineales bacterium]|nr:ribonuclease HII [Anaerolineales bacterium]
MSGAKASLPTAPSLDFERTLWRAGYQFIAGVDEAGRGALAGPVAAGAVILPCRADLGAILDGVRDSKLMSAAARQLWRDVICRTAVSWAVGFASQLEVDCLGILPATRLAASRAIDLLSIAPDYLLTDYLILSEEEAPQTGLVKGDRLVLSIAAASILAKTSRDQWMTEAGRAYPGYGFAQHKGYGTRQHRQALFRLGNTPLHRLSFHYSCADLD